MGERIMALELAGERVRAAVADRTWNALELIGAWEQARREGEADLVPAIARLIDAAGHPDVLVSALPGEFVAKRLLTLPFSDRRRLAQVVPFALEEHLPFPVDDAAVAFARVGREDGKTLVIAAFARKDDLKSHLELLSRAGLNPKTVTLGTLALAGLLARARNGSGGAHLVVDIDHGCTSMVLIDAQGTPRAVRTVGRGIHRHVRLANLQGLPELLLLLLAGNLDLPFDVLGIAPLDRRRRIGSRAIPSWPAPMGPVFRKREGIETREHQHQAYGCLKNGNLPNSGTAVSDP